MYNWDDILILGDSFAEERTPYHSWVQLVALGLSGLSYDKNRIPRGCGLGGTSWWSVRKSLIKELSIGIPKILIICHTEPHRLPNDKDIPLNYKSVLESRHPSDLEEAGRMYYKHLISWEFNNWAILQYFKELDEICNGIEKVLHFYCFEGPHTEYTFKKGVTFREPLFNYAEKSKPFIIRFLYKNLNHMILEKNRLLAENILHILDNYPGDGIKLHNSMVEKI
jgi:hypothetical protein